MDAGAERGQDAHAPVADLVPEPLQGHGAVSGQRASAFALLLDVGAEVRDGVRVERRFAFEPASGGGALPLAELAHEGAERPAQLQRSAGAIAVPEGHPPRLARRRPDDDPVAGDLGHPPGGGPEQEGVAGAGLVDHLLVEFAHPRTLRPQVNREQAAIRNRAGVHAHQEVGAAPGGQHVAAAVPRQPGPQVGELLRGKTADQHVQHRGQEVAGQTAVGQGAPGQGQDPVDGPFPAAAHRDDLLRQHVERVLRQLHRLDRAALHLDRGHRALQEVAPELGEDQTAAALADRVPRTADPLQSAGRRTRSLDEEHQVDAAHVDPQLERARRHDAAQTASLERALDLPSPFVGDAAVVGAGQRLTVFLLFLDIRRAGPVVQLVQPLRQPFAEGAAIDEDDGRAMAPHRLQNAREDGRPQPRRLEPTRPSFAGGKRLWRWRLHFRHRHDDLQVDTRRL